MYYLLKSGTIDIFYRTFSDGTGGLAALPHLDHHHLPVSDYCPSDTKVYNIIDGRIAFEVWPHDKRIRYQTEIRRLRSYWPGTVGELTAKSESEPDFVYE